MSLFGKKRFFAEIEEILTITSKHLHRNEIIRYIYLHKYHREIRIFSV